MAPLQVVGRLAPSPTGALHVGNARSFLLAWLSARQQQGRVILRIEDIDSPRVKPWATQATIDDLKWLGLDWDIGPDQTAARPASVPLVQSQRTGRYEAVLGQLQADGKIYPCYCSRSEIARAASAPHESQLEGPIYPGTCRPKGIMTPQELDFANTKRCAWRWMLEEGTAGWHDLVRGPQQANPAQQLGDFVVAKVDHAAAYQLAVVVDDVDMQVSEVVRGDDLIFSTYRQLAILRHLDWPVPTYAHVPLVVGPDGRRLAKRHGDSRLAHLRELGISSSALVGYLAWTLGLSTELTPLAPRELIGTLEWQALPKSETVFVWAEAVETLKRLSR